VVKTFSDWHYTMAYTTTFPSSATIIPFSPQPADQPGAALADILRPYQTEVIAEIEQAIAAGVRRIILVAPTGSGKTVTAGDG
jgi:type I site-specific restriction endonuclease